jgi:protein TonB
MNETTWLDEREPTLARRGGGGKWFMRVALGAALLGVIALVAWGAMSLMSGGKGTKRQVVQIALLKPPPPPPPPPPQVKPPEPPPPQEEVKIPQPQETPPEPDNAPPPEGPLGVDAAASGDGDGFGLAARKGGTDITKIGSGGGGLGKDRSAWFGGLVRSHLQAQLAKNDKLRDANYRVRMRVWFSSDGRLERFELVDSTGNAELDENIKLAMDKMPPLRQPPPEGIPQPVRLQVISKLAG